MPLNEKARTARLYFETLRHLKARQVVARLAMKLPVRMPSLAPAPPVRQRDAGWALPARRRQSLVSPTLFRFLNLEGDLEKLGWDNSAREKLWRYNQHYFDDLNAEDAAARRQWHRDLVERWIAAYPVGSGTAWEPYPTSLRIVNWIKASLGGLELSQTALDSLAVQVRWLSGRLEYHILGNHLFANAKALVFAGLFFEGGEAVTWLASGLRILEREIPEQILPDGGQFELSPMYQALALEDFLDLHNLIAPSGQQRDEPVRRVAEMLATRLPSMLGWLDAMCHPDGEISFFNDAAIGIAPAPAELHRYARDLGFTPNPVPGNGVTHLAASGYVRVVNGPATLIADLARVGPDYLPGHAHADTLSFEFSLFGQRLLVNSGTSVYGLGPERHRQRGTGAHNTLVIDGQDSSEVWGGFRVARRAHPIGAEIRSGDVIEVGCGHDGYRRLSGKPTHWRTWRLGDGFLEVEDRIDGTFHEAVAHYFLAPNVTPRVAGPDGSIELTLKDGLVRLKIFGGRADVVDSTYHPEFGSRIANRCLVLVPEGKKCMLRVEWEPSAS